MCTVQSTSWTGTKLSLHRSVFSFAIIHFRFIGGSVSSQKKIEEATFLNMPQSYKHTYGYLQ